MVLFLLSLVTAWSATVIVPEPNSSEAEYRAYMAAHADYISPTTFLLRARPSGKAKEHLVTLFAESQRAFLEGTPESARRQLEDLLTHIYDEDWSEAEREVFFNSALRRAQLGPDDSDQQKFLKLAASLSFGLYPDSKMFPPPLIQKYQSVLRAARKVRVQIAGLGSEWTLVLINGVRCSSKSCPELLDTGVAVRITYISDRWQVVTTISSPNQISAFIPLRKAWLGGNCNNARFDQISDQFTNPRAFFSISCEESKIAKKEINLKPMPATPDPLTMFSPKKDKPFYKSPWVWAGVGAAIAVIIVQSQNRKDASPEPSTSYGLQ